MQEPEVTAARPTNNKTTALLLAVFLSFWTWAYTYRRDNWKFWSGLSIWVFMILVLSANIGPYAWLMAPAVWVWSIVDTARKSKEWFNNFQ